MGDWPSQRCVTTLTLRIGLWHCFVPPLKLRVPNAPAPERGTLEPSLGDVPLVAARRPTAIRDSFPENGHGSENWGCFDRQRGQRRNQGRRVSFKWFSTTTTKPTPVRNRFS
jgi:hypothetical protein